MKILITGGAGFIGSNFVKHITNKYPEHKIINLDKLTYCGNLDNLTELKNNPNHTFIQGDICDKELVESLVAQVDTIVHFAAETQVDRSITDSCSYIQTDVVGTHTLLEAARKNDIKKFVHISTDEVYGQIHEGEFKETEQKLLEDKKGRIWMIT